MIGRSNPALRRIRALRRDRALRDADGVLVAEGVHLAQEALATGARIVLAVVAARLSRTDEGRDLRQRLEKAARVLETSDDAMTSIQDARSPQPVLLIVERPRAGVDDVLRAGGGGPALVVIACGLQDPGNLGALIRTADAASATGVLAAGDGVDLFHPRVVRATMGSLFRLPVASTPVGDVSAALARSGIALVGADARGDLSYAEFDWRPPTAVAIGSEGPGLPDAIDVALDARVRIPMRAGVESLSASAAGAVILFEAARQRRMIRSLGG